ncbi:uncharacterized protein LOC128992813 [Macrosteles quadrilineatus]|uniref:uncharacterized protein LOC128992813 n=1 Tax=Macrosteles quadrilineatus TaxID=74068 RepID=UPI0023E24C51|nr:uncharacterized protein LOC128992813 [Macrosteles quadrilineatus]
MPKEMNKTYDHPEPPFVAVSSNPNTTILLATALVHLKANNGNTVVARAVIDSASMVSCVTENIANLLMLKRTFSSNSKIDGLSSVEVKSKGVSKVNISSLSGEMIADNNPVLILDRITSNLPHSEVPVNVKEYFKHLVLADPTFHLPSKIDVLIGADLFAKVITGERIIINKDLPAAMNSVFGYLIIGSAPTLPAVAPQKTAPQCKGNVSLLSTQDIDLHNSLQKFWTLEEPPIKHHVTSEQEICENHFLNTVSRDSNGRYFVRLPIKENHPPLGDSSFCARNRFLSLERKLESQPEVKAEYNKAIHDLLSSSHMEPVNPPPNSDNKQFYLPHHAIVKVDSSTTKLRVVYDASARSSSGVSLNDILHTGPKLHNDLNDILLKFRLSPIVFSCDIKQMFRQIMIHPDDRNYQMLYWRDDKDDPLSVYRLTTVVFGFNCSPYLALRTLHQLITDEGANFPLAAEALKKQVYVDDLILGANSIEQALVLRNEVEQLLLKGCFELRKWTSNCPQIMETLPDSYKETPLYFNSSDQPYFKVLGIKWSPNSDTFSYQLNIPDTPPTKRGILGTVSRIFDPNGWLTPVTLWVKALIQVLWALGLSWDAPVPPDLTEKWSKFLQQLPFLSELSLPRYVSVADAVHISLHGFCDGSETGYGACVYLRCVSSSGEINVHLLIAKARVAPLKKISIPRLELCGAHLLSKLLNYCNSLLSQDYLVNELHAWCDSSVVLSWIKTVPYRLKVYVANRVSEIQELTPPYIWKHVSTHCNPADIASRGTLPISMKDNSLWWNGPNWLSLDQESWPIPRFTPLQDEQLPERKVEPLPIMVTTKKPDLFNRFSSWSTLQRVIAYVLRFKNNLTNQVKESGLLKLEELDKATITICKMIQQTVFSEDISRLKDGKPCSSRLASLSPFLDENGLIRVGGRLKHSQVSYAAKHPIVLPKTNHVTNLIVDHYHLKHLHAGPQFLQAVLSQKFWILSARSIIRRRVYKCIRCVKCNPKTTTQKMGDLPPQRVLPSRVFNNCGTDFLGPFSVKPCKLRKSCPIKVYVCIFICFSVKAVHLEVVTDLSSEAYLAALTRFVSRRGLCSNIYSDCGTNYVGAANEVQKIVKNFFVQKETQEALSKFAMENNITFHFLPPAAPHQGGLWERTVRSVKHHLRRVIGEQILTLEEFITLTTRIEAILNSRPITPLSSDPSEIDCLTPGHFLIGGPLLSLPEPDWKDVSTNRLSRWKFVQALTQSFWKIWQKEYLYTLQ